MDFATNDFFAEILPHPIPKLDFFEYLAAMNSYIGNPNETFAKLTDALYTVGSPAPLAKIASVTYLPETLIGNFMNHYNGYAGGISYDESGRLVLDPATAEVIRSYRN